MTKKTDAQALKWMRAVCLAYPDATEGVHYGEIVFKSAGKMFASCGDKHGPTMIVLGLAPDHTKDVLAQNPAWKRYPYEKSGIMIAAGDVDDWDQLRAFIDESWRKYASTAPAKKAAKVAKKAPAKQAKKKAKRSA
jgi:predicted DNA-binding protein (MmcQ/YjbR family)